MIEMWVRTSNIVVLMFDLWRPSSLKFREDIVSLWQPYRQDQRRTFSVLVGNKNDQTKSEDIEKTRRAAKAFQKKHCIRNYYGVSAKTGDHVDRMFEESVINFIRGFMDRDSIQNMVQKNQWYKTKKKNIEYL
eukprot:gb/GECH01001094.1/.p1 GENE.gb/GECH01001094.1/~~gb/GECH01001094.1/.p1  ORF type:complete len:133 (+),score=19.60 gb/GECH01001094.1/:1-399(+)